jgi:HPt (histidine-containing phosphotransfer) domain-containing protein
MLGQKEIAGLRIDKGLTRFGGNEATYVDLLRIYAVNMRKQLRDIQNVDESNIRLYEITVHGIKGSSDCICAEAIAGAARGLENAAKKRDWDYINKCHAPFLDMAEGLLKALDELLSAIESEGPKLTKDKPSVASLSRLLSACEAYDMDEAELAIKSIGRFRYDADGGLADWLKENMEQMNFEEISEKLCEILNV